MAVPSRPASHHARIVWPTSTSTSGWAALCVPSFTPPVKLLRALSAALDDLNVTLSMLETALGVSDLMPALERLFAGKK